MTKPKSDPRTPPDQESAPKREIDWEAIELDYRAGVLSTRELATQYGVSHTLINRKAKKGKWPRDLSAKVKAKADALVSKQGVSTGVSVETENQTVEANAALQAKVRLQHRTDIAEARSLFQILLAEVKTVSTPEGITLAEALSDALATANEDEPEEIRRARVSRMRETLNKVLSMGGRIDGSKKLVEMLEKLVKMEREAYGIDAAPVDDPRNRVQLTDAERAVRLAAFLAKAPIKAPQP